MSFYSFACYRGTSFRSYKHSTPVGAETCSAMQVIKLYPDTSALLF